MIAMLPGTEEGSVSERSQATANNSFTATKELEQSEKKNFSPPDAVPYGCFH